MGTSELNHVSDTHSLGKSNYFVCKVKHWSMLMSWIIHKRFLASSTLRQFSFSKPHKDHRWHLPIHSNWLKGIQSPCQLWKLQRRWGIFVQIPISCLEGLFCYSWIKTDWVHISRISLLQVKGLQEIHVFLLFAVHPLSKSATPEYRHLMYSKQGDILRCSDLLISCREPLG